MAQPQVCAVCKDIEQTDTYYCPLIKKTICDLCCSYDMMTHEVDKIVFRLTHKEMDLARIVGVCNRCGKRK